jgi:hypothetical protein
VLFRIEWYNLNAFVRYLKLSKMHVHVTIHDGLQASGREPPNMLQAACDFIFAATGFRKTIVEKPIQQHDLGALLESVLPPSLPNYSPRSSKLSKFMDTSSQSNLAVTKDYLETDLFTKAAKGADFISCKSWHANGENRKNHGVYPSHYDARRRILFICQRQTIMRSLEARTGEVFCKGANSAQKLTCDEAQLELAKVRYAI